jgi:hypothetical protein
VVLALYYVVQSHTVFLEWDVLYLGSIGTIRGSIYTSFLAALLQNYIKLVIK